MKVMEVTRFLALITALVATFIMTPAATFATEEPAEQVESNSASTSYLLTDEDSSSNLDNSESTNDSQDISDTDSSEQSSDSDDANAANTGDNDGSESAASPDNANSSESDSGDADSSETSTDLATPDAGTDEADAGTDPSEAADHSETSSTDTDADEAANPSDAADPAETTDSEPPESFVIQIPNEETARYSIGEVVNFGTAANSLVNSFGEDPVSVSGTVKIGFEGYGINRLNSYVTMTLTPVGSTTASAVKFNLELIDTTTLTDPRFSAFNHDLLMQCVTPAGISIDTIQVDNDTITYNFRLIYNCNIYFNLNGGIGPNRSRQVRPQEMKLLSICDGIPTLASDLQTLSKLVEPTKPGYTFDGWYAAADDLPDVLASFTSLDECVDYLGFDDTGNYCLYLTAHWTPDGDSQEPQEPQDPQNPQDSQEPQEPHNSQDPQDSQNPQSSQDNQNPQNPQDTQNPPVNPVTTLVSSNIDASSSNFAAVASAQASAENIPAGTSVRVELQVNKANPREAETDLVSAARSLVTNNNANYCYIDTEVIKRTTNARGTTEKPLYTLGHTIEIAIPLNQLDITTRGAITLSVARKCYSSALEWSTGAVLQSLTERPTANFSDGTVFYDQDNNLLYLYASKPCNQFALVWTSSSSESSNGGSGSNNGSNSSSGSSGGGSGGGGSSPSHSNSSTSGGSSSSTSTRTTTRTSTSTSTSTSTTTESSGFFRDITVGDWYYDSITSIAHRGWMDGTGNNEFSPQLSMSRGMLATVLYRMVTAPEVTSVIVPFHDINPSSYYATPVAWAYSAGIVTGYNDTTFAPNDNITREQMVVMLQRFARYLAQVASTSAELNFVDASQVSPYAVSALQWAVGNDLIRGRTGNILAPQAEITRAECATIIERFASYVTI